MQFLYKAYACEEIPGHGKLLLPGFPVRPDLRPMQPGEKIKLELADGTFQQTVLTKTHVLSYDESVLERFPKVPRSPFYYVVQVLPILIRRLLALEQTFIWMTRQGRKSETCVNGSLFWQRASLRSSDMSAA